MRRLVLAFLLSLSCVTGAVAGQVKQLKITVLSTMLADRGLGEWGYAALVEADGRRILYDTGARPETVLRNAVELGVDLAAVEDVVLSHHHGDHTGGLLTLRASLSSRNPKALSRVHVADGFFLAGAQGFRASLPKFRESVEASGARFIVHAGAAELAPGVWLTGPVPRRTEERNYPPFKLPDGSVDHVPDDQALVFDTSEGVVALTGCGHAGAINIVRRARELGGGKPLLALIGGLHLFEADDAHVDWTAAQLKAAGVRYLLMGHCTGLEATMRLRTGAGLTRRTAAYGANGAMFTLGKGIDPMRIAS